MTVAYETYDGTLYDYSAGALCGVLVKERVMKKLAALQAKHLEDVKRVLSQGADNGDVFQSDWTLHYPNGVQTEVRFLDPLRDGHERIKRAITAHPPRAHKLVFIATCMDDAKKAADAHYLATSLETA
jgi:hypothetical protein